MQCHNSFSQLRQQHVQFTAQCNNFQLSERTHLPRCPCFKGIMGTVWSFPLLICEESHSLPWQQRFYFDTVVSCSCPKIEGGYPCHHILVGSMPLLTLMLSNVGLMSLFPGLCHYSLHAGSVGLLHTLDTKVRMLLNFLSSNKSSLRHNTSLQACTLHQHAAFFHNATALRSVSMLSLLSFPSIARLTWFTCSHDKAYPLGCFK